MSWKVEMQFDDRWILLADRFDSRHDAEWFVAGWKQRNKMTGDPFRYSATRNTGTLRLNEGARWEIVDGDGVMLAELHCGDVIECKVGGHWIPTSVEHNTRQGYFATASGVRLQNGLPARRPA